MPKRDRTVTRTSELALEPQIREFAGVRYLGGALGVALLVGLGLLAVRELASVEELLAAEGSSSARAVAYELPRGGELRVPIEPRTDVLRFVVNAYRRGAALPLTPRAARVVVEARGDRGARTEELEASAPGVRTHVTAQEPGLSVGDPIAFDVDVHDLGAGELVVRLSGIDDADGLLARAYRREQLSESEAAVRGATLDRRRKDLLAQWTWELGWDELTPAERDAVLATRWHRIGALRGGGHELRSVPIALSPPRENVRGPHGDPLLGRVALRGDERIGVLAQRGAELDVVADASATLRATVRRASGQTSTEEGVGSLAIVAPDDPEPASVEIASDRDVIVELRAREPDKIEWLGNTSAWRATASRPIVVDSPEAPRVVRVSMRRAMDRRDAGQAVLAARVEVTGPSLPRAVSQTFRADQPRSRFDRYEAFDPLEAPTERSVFYVAIPEGGAARIAPAAGGALDVSLAELDESARPEPLVVRPAGAPPQTVRLEGERTSAAFVPRRPSNVAELEPDAHVALRVSRHRVAIDSNAPVPALAHVKRGAAARVERGGRTFEAVLQPFDVELGIKRPVVVPIVAFASQPTTLSVEVVHDAPRVGVFAHWTLPRTMSVGDDETRAAFVVGDDVPGGRAKIRVVEAKPEGARVHFPWVPARAAGPRWITGQFEE